MRSFLCAADFLICSIFVIVVFFGCCANAEQGRNREFYMIPQARVGRSDPNLLKNLNENGEAAAWENLAYSISSEEYEEQGKNRRDNGVSYMIPLARVGRSDPSLLKNLHENGEMSILENLAYPISSEEYDEPLKIEERRSMKAFPRVGKADAEMRKWAHMLALQQALDKRTGPSATSGLWFGPRLGKRSIDDSIKQQIAKGQKEQV